MRKNVNDWERAVSIVLGAALLGLAIRRRRLTPANAVTATGLLLRGASGFCPVNAAIGRNSDRDDTKRALGGARGIRLDASVVVRRPVDEVYVFWRDLRNLSRFMPHIERVDILDATRSHWVVRGPAGTQFEWDAEIINAVRPVLVAWQSLPGADVASAGSVKFRQLSPADTQVDVTLQYAPPAGKAGAAAATLLGESPAGMLREDLGRLKVLLEQTVVAV